MIIIWCLIIRQFNRIRIKIVKVIKQICLQIKQQRVNSFNLLLLDSLKEQLFEFQIILI